MKRNDEVSTMIHNSDRNIILFERCLVIQLQRVYRPCDRRISSVIGAGSFACESGSPTPNEEESLLSANGPKLFQIFQEANSKCFWNTGLLQAIASVHYRGHVAPSTLLLTGNETALEIVRGAWARKVLRAPMNYQIVVVGDLEGCNVQPIVQGQFTPLPEALCYVIWDLNQAGRAATLEAISAALQVAFPELIPPTHPVIYATLGALIKDRKIYHTGSGYGVVTPETYRRTAYLEDDVSRPILMSDEEALVLAHGATEVFPAGYVTHRAVQTNLVDVICRGSPTDRIMYPRSAAEILNVTPPLPSKLERQRSLRVLAVRKVSTLEQKLGGSLRLSPSKAKKLMEASLDSTHCLSNDITVEHYQDVNQDSATKDKSSLLSRIFKKATLGRRKNVQSSFSAQFPPPEWMEPGPVLHLHSVAVQTCPSGKAPEEDGALGFVPVRQNLTESRRSRSQSRPHVKDIFNHEEVRRPSSLHRPTTAEIHSSDERSVISRRSAIPSSVRHSLDETSSRASSLGRRSALRHLKELDERLDSEFRASIKQPVSPTRSVDSQYSSMPDQNSRFSSPNRNSPTPSDCRSTNSDRRSPLRDVSSPRHRKSTVDNGRSFTLPSVCESAETPKKTTVSRSDSYKNANKLEFSAEKRAQKSEISAERKPQAVQPVMASVLPQNRPISSPMVAVSPQKVQSPERCISPVKQAIAENRERFFQDQVRTPKSIEDKIDQMKSNHRMSIMEDLKSPNLVRTTNFHTTNFLEHRLSPSFDCTVQIPSGKKISCPETKIKSPDGSRIINISVTRSESMSYAKGKAGTLIANEKIGDFMQSEKYPEKCADFIKIDKCADFTSEKFAKIEMPGLNHVPDSEESTEFRTFPSLTELNIHFKSITGQRILQGISANSIDTLVEVNMRADGKEETVPVIENLGFV